MPSPFPGMNPWLEQDDAWEDFHHSFILAARTALAMQVRPNYIVKVEEHLYIHELPDDARRLIGRADVSLARSQWPAQEPIAAGTLQAPVQGMVPLSVDIERSVYLEIQDRYTRELVTVVELLSPTNKKSGPDREQFLAKRRRLLMSGVHCVEIDLLRGGPRLPVEGLPACNYYALVSRAEERPRVDLWPVRLSDPLPEMAIPLRPTDGDARLDLQETLHRVYDAAGYEDYIYAGQPQPPFRPEEAEWARQFLPTSP